MESKKIGVSYIYHPPPSPPSENADTSGSNEHHEGADDTVMDYNTPAKSVPSQDYDTCVAGAAGGAAAAAAATNGTSGYATNEPLQQEGQRSTGFTENSSYTSSSSRHNNDTNNNDNDTVKREVNQAKEKLSTMSKEAKQKAEQAVPENTKQQARNVAQQVQRHQPNGVPVPVVLVLALLAFLIGWKLF